MTDDSQTVGEQQDRKARHGVPSECDSCNQSLVSFSPEKLRERETCPYCRNPMETAAEEVDG